VHEVDAACVTLNVRPPTEMLAVRCDCVGFVAAA
jgi:hypothetical protein